MTTVRYYGSFPMAAAMTGGLFLAMQGLVGWDDGFINETPRKRINIIFAEPPEEPEVRQVDRLDPPPDVISPPPVEPIVTPGRTDKHIIPTVTPPKRVGPQRQELERLTFSDGDYVPLVRVQPQYPSRALERGIEGHVVVQFDIAPDGSVPVGSISIVEAEPAGYFERAARKAASRLKYKPRVVNGSAQEVVGLQYRFGFTLND